MDVIEAENVKIPNSVLVDGLTGEAIDNEVIEYLGQHGPIGRIIKVTSSEARFKDTTIVEFKSGEPIQFLQSTLPCRWPTSNPNITNHIQCLSDLYAADRGSTLTHIYLAELKGVAKLSGADFEKVLLEELTRIHESTKSQTAEPGMSKTDPGPQLTSDITSAEVLTNLTQTPVKWSLTHEHDSLSLIVGAEALPSPKKPALYLSSEQLTSPEVQKMVVEHVIRNTDVVSQYHGVFLGKLPVPA